ncbi:MAG: helix-turn-helix transcriptional regulator, partial [Longicatena sp.]
MDKLLFANKVMELRKKQGLTQQQLADRLHVTNKAISRWETGEGFPDIMLLKPLSEALGISCDELLSEHVSYTDIKKSDIQKYIPYGVAALSLLFYYILGKLSVPFILSFFILLAGLWASCYLMIHHTNKEKLPSLIRFDAVMLYFPVVSLFQTITMIWYLLKQSGFSLQGLLFNFNM